MAKLYCITCKSKQAVWIYMPGGEDIYYCDDCISSPEDQGGCSCNWRHIDDEQPEGFENKDWRWINKSNGSWMYLDDRGRPNPCCEFEYDEQGFDILKTIHLTSEQIKMVENIWSPASKNGNYFVDVKIHLKNGEILTETIINNKIFINEELSITNEDILNITT